MFNIYVHLIVKLYNTQVGFFKKMLFCPYFILSGSQVRNIIVTTASTDRILMKQILHYKWARPINQANMNIQQLASLLRKKVRIINNSLKTVAPSPYWFNFQSSPKPWSSDKKYIYYITKFPYSSNKKRLLRLKNDSDIYIASSLSCIRTSLGLIFCFHQFEIMIALWC